MNSYSKTIIPAIFLILFSLFQLSASGNDNQIPFVVVIDAGHGGKDPGAIGGKLQEKDINLSVSKKLGALLENSDFNVKVVYTRNSDVFVDLSERTSISNRSNANLFISIHSNASRNYSARGIETYVMGMEKSNENLQVSMRENSVITQEDDYSVKYEGYDPLSSESYIIFSLQQHSYQNESLKLATELQNIYSKYASSQMLDKGVKQANFLVLWKTAAPSILTEIGFISNQSDRMYISSEKGQDIIAKSIFEAITNYIKSYNCPSVSSASSASTTSFVSSQSTVATDNSSTSINNSLSNSSESSKVSHKLQYKVQVMASKNPVSVTRDNFFEWSTRVICEYDGNIFKYLVLGANVYEETLTLRDSLRKKFPDCFIVSFYDGKAIKLDEARSIEATMRK